MEVLGAMIIFFSWVVTNALTQRYVNLKLSLESSQRSFRLYNTLHELRSMINSLGLEIIQGLPKGIDATRFRAGRHHIDDVEAMRETFCVERVSAHQVRELIDFIFQTIELADTVRKDSHTSKEIQQELLAVEECRDELQKLESEAETELGRSNSFESHNEFIAIPAYVKFFRDQVLPRVPEFYRRIVELSNQTQEQARMALKRAQLQARVAKYASLALYAAGSLLILTSKLAEYGS